MNRRRLSSTCISPAYQFSDENCLVECAKLLISIGSDTIKFSLVPQSIGISTLPATIKTLQQLVANEPNYRCVFDMPELKNYILWAYTLNGSVVKDGMSRTELDAEYKQIYDLTQYLLTKYNGTKKTFYLGNWESDWGALGITGYNGADPEPIRVQSLIDYFNIRQKAVDDAKASIRFQDVNVYHYAEIVMVKDIIQNAEGYNKRCINAVIPYVSQLDYVSWSAYTIQDDSQVDVSKWLDVVESYLPSSKMAVIPGKRVFIGEFGWKFLDGIAAAYRMAKFAQAVFDWGCPFAIFWEIYSNERNTKFHLIRPDGTETEKLQLMNIYMRDTNKYSVSKCMVLLEGELCQKSSDMVVCNDGERVLYTADHMYHPNTTLLLKDRVHVDMNGYNQNIVAIVNAGIQSEITNSCDTCLSKLRMLSSCDGFGSFAGDVFSGVRNAKGNSIISGNVQLVVSSNTTYIANACHAYIGGTVAEPNSKIVVLCNNGLGYGDVIVDGQLVLGCESPISSKIIIGRTCTQVCLLKTCSYKFPMYIGETLGTSACGLIEAQSGACVTLEGKIVINGMTKYGGHFGSHPNSCLVISGSIESNVPVIWRRNYGVLCGGGLYDVLVIAQGTLRIGKVDGVCTTANLTMGTHGAATLDLNGFNQTISNIRGSKAFNCIITNSGVTDATLSFAQSTRAPFVIKTGALLIVVDDKILV